MLAHAGFESINVYSRHYHLQFSDIPDVVYWWSSAGLRPYLGALPEGAQEHFKEAFAEGFEITERAKASNSRSGGSSLLRRKHKCQF
jgi:trans-aconitate methyltransferase